MPRAAPSARARARLAAAMLVALGLAGCQGFRDAGSELFPEGNSIEAALSPLGGSAASGSVIVGPTRSGVAMRVNLRGLPMMHYRVIIHANGNCSSRNGFSAGPPLILPGATEHVMAHTPSDLPVADGALTMVVRIPGVRLDGPNGIAGKAVVVHAGTEGSLEAVPDVPNNRVACGVLGAKARREF